MLIQEAPRYGIHYRPGDVFFTWRPGSFLTHNIGLESAAERLEAGLAVPTHCGLISGKDERIEADWPQVRRAPLDELWQDAGCLVAVRRPAGQTTAAMEASLTLAGDKVGSGYDGGGLFGFTLTEPEQRGQDPNFLESPERYFCSELVAYVLKATAHLRQVATPPALKAKHASWWTPFDLYVCERLWE